MFGNHGLGGLLKEGAHEKSPKCLGGNLGDFGEFCKGLGLFISYSLHTLFQAGFDEAVQIAVQYGFGVADFVACAQVFDA